MAEEQLRSLKYKIDYYEEKCQFNNKNYKRLKTEYNELKKEIEKNMSEQTKINLKEKEDKLRHELGKLVDEMQLKQLRKTTY